MEPATKKTSLLGNANEISVTNQKYNSFNHSSPVMSCIEHVLSPSDTLQGIAIKYGVKVADIRKANNMWAQDNIFLRKTLLIPTVLAPGAALPDGANATSPRKIQRKSSTGHVSGTSPTPLSHVSPDPRPTSHLSRTPITAYASDEIREQQFTSDEDLFSL